MKNEQFIPVILGTDTNAYGMAKAFHKGYGIKSIVVGKGVLFPTHRSKIVDVKIYEDFGTEAGFLQRMLSLGQSLKGNYNKLLLIASSDGYVEQIIKNKKALSAYYEMPFIDEDLMVQLNSKETFYKTCETYGLDYPKTHLILPNQNEVLEMPFEFPVVLKPSDSMRYFEARFEGKKKAYVLSSLEELNQTIKTIRYAGYEDTLIMQAYIPGDDSAMRVLNCYSDQHGKVKLMSLGQPVLEDCTPELIGNYTAIIDAYDENLFDQYKAFLEAIGYVGFSNFDMKFDHRDGTYKIFEINLRQGRSSYFTVGSGYNLAEFLVRDRVYGEDLKTVYAKSEHLWLGMPPKVVLAYTKNPELKKKIETYIKEKKTSYTLYYKEDRVLKRLYAVYRYYRGYEQKYKTHFVDKT